MCVCVWTVPVTAVSYSTDLPSLSQECLLRLSDVRRRIMVNILVYRDLQVFLLEQLVGWWAEGWWLRWNQTVQGAGTSKAERRTALFIAASRWVQRWQQVNGLDAFCQPSVLLVFPFNIYQPIVIHTPSIKMMYAIFFDATWNGSGRFLRCVWHPSDVTGDHPRHFLSDDQPRDRLFPWSFPPAPNWWEWLSEKILSIFFVVKALRHIVHSV